MEPFGARGYSSYADVSPSDVLSHFNFGLMGSFEAQYKRWGIPFDFVYAKLGDNKTFTNFPGYSANPTVKEAILTPKVTYLVLDGERMKIKATLGPRYWHVGANLKITPPGAPSVSAGSSLNWADVVAGANIVAPLSPRIAFMVLGMQAVGALTWIIKLRGCSTIR